MGAGTMAMGFFVKTDRKARDMGTHHALGHFEKDRRVALAALTPFNRFDIDDVGDEVGFDHPVAIKLTAAGEETFFALEPLGE